MSTNGAGLAITSHHRGEPSRGITPANHVLHRTAQYEPSQRDGDKMSEDAKFALGY